MEPGQEAALDTRTRFAQLERRIEALEDERAIYELMASYGPAVDSNSRQEAARLWISDGVYDVDVGEWRGQDAIAAMLGGDYHQSCLADGCSHQVSISKVTVDGDAAVATGYMQLIVRSGETFELRRQTVQRWELVRTAEGWRISHRTGRLIDGGPDARGLLARALDK
jgi:uncharacterized protein (TIGR02246 family)